MSAEHEEEQDHSRSVAPALPADVRVKLHAYIQVKLDEDPDHIAAQLRRLHTLWKDEPYSQQLTAVSLVVADLVDQGWRVTPTDEAIELEPPGLRLREEHTDDAKARIRQALRVGRNRQLEQASVQRFLRRMERPRLSANASSSILALVDDGQDLARDLRLLSKTSQPEREAKLSKIVDPFIQSCANGERDEQTGLKLSDIWRYFRHTWSLEYRSIPGREMPVLIRNRARKNMPVIGIGMLASPVVRSEARDNWIGWTRTGFLQLLEEGKLDASSAWATLTEQVRRSIDEIRWDDLITTDELSSPTEPTIWRLEQNATAANEERAQGLRAHYEATVEGGVSSHTKGVKRADDNVDWKAASEDPLFVSKRAKTLADLLFARMIFNENKSSKNYSGSLQSLFQTTRGLKAIDIVLKEVRKYGLSSRVADVSVCGAIAPYNELLGGKLVALLLASREMQELYQERYGNQISLISSQMAGRAIRRPANLMVLTTTSLYGVGTSQYNRLHLRAGDHPELTHDLRWTYLKKTKGYGTVHLSKNTVRALRTIAEQEYGARRINNRFGEGASPRLRQIREGLEVLGIQSDDVLNHATPRRFFACELTPNARMRLLGVLSDSNVQPPSCAGISAAWRRRWLSKRVTRDDVILRLQRLGPSTVKKELLVCDKDGQLSLPFE